MEGSGNWLYLESNGNLEGPDFHFHVYGRKDTFGVCLGLGTILQGEFNASLLEMPKIGARKIPKTSEGAPCHGLLWRWLGSPMFGYLLVASCRLDKNLMKFRL